MFGRSVNTECLLRENRLNCCYVGNVDDDYNGDDDDDNEDNNNNNNNIVCCHCLLSGLLVG
jgi:hypothetical protein